MTIDKPRRAFLAFAIFAISCIAITPCSAAVAKPKNHPGARNHAIHWTSELRKPAAQSKSPVNDPFASMLLG
jgi:hypothetical protein